MEIKQMPVTGQQRNMLFPAVMSEEEMAGYTGGKLPAAAWWTIVTTLVANWGDIREGFSDGISGKPPRYKS